MAICYLGLGSNLGNRKRNIQLAVKNIKLLRDTCILKKSKIAASFPVGGPSGQGNYLNAALKIETKLTPINLLKKLKKIEIILGRFKSVRFAPRIIDLDILLYADKVINSKKLTIPHPRMFERDFVINPLKEAICR
ncbi:MAG: 2-amino-4-hydroxy-6-hydroxymethyldihydropteridine diphosphokinase [Candidatus Omnitrophica bacterium]|nr:2-amino-4-hydroxy-6-hydroxymethyldihydropteridine diphosphokinase [Candidatus Omnitrophota bacterium]MDO9573179.1 2-amino-4-hydroxy-6-hydroxymethyldihydropteridine diphosphokinase [Candidatus Omnitrophota bacterium]